MRKKNGFFDKNGPIIVFQMVKSELSPIEFLANHCGFYLTFG